MCNDYYKLVRVVSKTEDFIELLTESEERQNGARKSWVVKKPPTNEQLMNKLNEVIKVLNRITNPEVKE